jgi:hypothetical protein
MRTGVLNPDGIWLLKLIKFLIDISLSILLVLNAPFIAIILAVGHLIRYLCHNTRSRILHIVPITWSQYLLCFGGVEFFLLPVYLSISSITNTITEAIGHNLYNSNDINSPDIAEDTTIIAVSPMREAGDR